MKAETFEKFVENFVQTVADENYDESETRLRMALLGAQRLAEQGRLQEVMEER